MSVFIERLPAACRTWLRQVDHLMSRNWSLDVEGAGWSVQDVLRYWKFGDAPEEFVAWYADKYDLLRFE